MHMLTGNLESCLVVIKLHRSFGCMDALDEELWMHVLTRNLESCIVTIKLQCFGDVSSKCGAGAEGVQRERRPRASPSA
eukprot:206188-Pelagomonas_calceolata.AAC.2